MESDPPDNPLPAISARAIAFLDFNQRLAYARLDGNFQIRFSSDHLGGWLAGKDGPIQDRPLTEVIPEFIGAEEQLRRVLSSEIPVYELEKVQRQGPAGQTRYLNLQVIRDCDPETGLILVVEEVTRTSLLEQRLVQDRNELRLAQASLARANAELQRLSRLKSLFLSIAAHDLRAPLTAITGYAGLARSELTSKAPQEIDQFLSIIEEQAGWLDRLIDDLLDLDQIERGKLSVQPQTCALAPLLDEVVERMRILAGQKGLTLELHTDRTTQPVLADPRRVRQILYNLLSNAVKYTPEGGRIQVKAWDEQGFGVIQVQDSGPGIPGEESAHLFELYYRFGETGRRSPRGTGLGLFIVKHLVEAQGGKIDADTQPGQGTAFRVYLPDTLDSGEEECEGKKS